MQGRDHDATWGTGQEGHTLVGGPGVDVGPEGSSRRVDTHLLAAGIVIELVITGMQRLAGVDWVQDHLVTDDHLPGQCR